MANQRIAPIPVRSLEMEMKERLLAAKKRLSAAIEGIDFDAIQTELHEINILARWLQYPTPEIDKLERFLNNVRHGPVAFVRMNDAVIETSSKTVIFRNGTIIFRHGAVQFAVRYDNHRLTFKIGETYADTINTSLLSSMFWSVIREAFEKSREGVCEYTSEEHVVSWWRDL